MEKYTILTGGAGFIGSAVLRVLNDHGLCNIVVVDDLGCGDVWKNLVGKKFALLLHKDQLFDWLEGKEQEVEGFIHLGACSSTVECDANFLMRNNYHYSMSLAEFALTHNLRFVYASSAATYGDGSLGFSDDHDLLEQLRPLNMYGYSKHLFDLWLQQVEVLDRVVGLKYFNVFGPNEYHKGRMSSAIVKMVPEVQNQKKISLFASNEPDLGDGEQKRDFIYVKDAALMTVSAYFEPKGGIYNVGTGEAKSWNRLAKAVIAALGIEAKIEYIPMPEDLVGKYQNYTCAEMKKWPYETCRFTLEEAVSDYVNDYLQEEKIW